MKKTKILAHHIVFLMCLAAGIPFSFAQDALDQLNAQTSQPNDRSPQDAYQGTIGEKTSVSEGAINNDKIKSTMSSGEYKNFSSAQAYIEQNSQYTLGADDVIDIVVMRHPEVSGEYILNKEGKIQYEFVGDVDLAGYTKEQAIAVLSKKLSAYIIRPEISLKISGYNSKIVYVVGEVASPGRIAMRGDTITVRDALLAAGLPLITAAGKRSSLFTPAATGNVVRKNVDVEALIYKGDLRQNFIMHPGDCLYVPATFLAKAMRAISPVTTPVENVAGAGGAAKYAF